MAKEAKYRVAVYGTLRNGEHNHHLLKDCELMGTTMIPGFVMINLGGFPGILPVPLEDWEVVVEIYEVDARTLSSLDVLEGVGRDFYTRERIDTPLFGKVEIYVLHPLHFGQTVDSGRKIGMFMGGDWMEEDTYDLDMEDIQTYIDPDYLKVAGITPTPPASPKKKGNIIPFVRKEEPKEPDPEPMDWTRVFGPVSKAKQLEELIRA
jgi:gamma-glutamylcyclotransferase (GGCT)/AIG2-like uncharacterized protein YtfP